MRPVLELLDLNRRLNFVVASYIFKILNFVFNFV
jgi:hypothetical protein